MGKRENLMQDLLRFKDDIKYCVFDYETEDLNLVYTRPWQYACVVADKNEIKGSHDLFLWWDDLNVSEVAKRVTRFDLAKYQRLAKDPHEQLEIINDCFDRADFVLGHNIIGFDIHVYRNLCYRLGKHPLPVHKKMIDTLAFGKGIKLDIPYKKFENPIAYQMKMIGTIIRKRGFATLKAFCLHYGIKYDDKQGHDALYDVEVNYRVWQKMMWDIEL